ncbi:MAG: anhydro-N-acetylmuramic acid kinase [Bacteroidota bacterium]|nr:anhydro-N-acetylmuramic acid kinase [Bacteroidota bacterium]
MVSSARSPLAVLTALLSRDTRLVCGIMSGTSVDAVDVALVRIRGKGRGTAAELLGHTATRIPDDIRTLVLANAEAATSNVSDICILHAALAHLYADAVKETCRHLGIETQDIDVIGLHGQTLHHRPNAVTIAGWEVRSTFQAGSGPMLATLLGVPVVYDFRSADMAAGGQGAPLVPYADYLLFRSDTENRILLNIGGIANITWLPAACTEDNVLAHDTGPGNIVVDALMQRLYGRSYDEGGEIAHRGVVNPDLLAWMLKHPYFGYAPPKSTGREMFGTVFIESLLMIARDLDVREPQDIVATAAECTVRTIARDIEAMVSPGRAASVYIGGGGAKNRFITEGLRHRLADLSVQRFDRLGIPAEARESVCFAVLANEWLHGNAANLPQVTGASRKIILGSFALG